MRKTEPVIIIGAGIGGLAAALALKRVGIEANVFERVESLGEIGAGLTLWANAVKVLRKLGLEEITRSAHTLESSEIYSWQGKRLSSISGQMLQRRLGAPSLALHRAELQAALLAAVGPENLALGHQCESFEQDDHGVTAHFTNGQRIRGSALIGADGIHSTVRAHLFGAQKPRYAGYTAWRGVTVPPQGELRSGEYWGCGTRFGLVPLSQERYYWFATRNAQEHAPEDPAGRKHELLSLFAHWHTAIPALIEATPEEAILRNDIYDRPTLSHWTKGCVTLLGDAAHPMTPNLGQGACQALEDAFILAQCLEQSENTNIALQLYQSRRIPRTTRVAQLSWQIGFIGQWKHPLACALRDASLKWLPSRLQFVSLAEAAGYEI